ncbi:hypothetical protein [Cylindrospermum sp. FACHB-282]|uniref:hypothetical protein n=1 Tax=Cylindrospermum sp. FACHB-282 TaxID=2692794 RepID=UPI00168432B4|nr:hypothetical protein [Cylindrospermum sp. FACHB-282]MBD2387260.1 hypothetical protein [Cylindrospermum sp. FACHB-282]
MNRLFRFLASCILSVIVALCSIVSPALAQLPKQVQMVKNLPAILSKDYTYYIDQTSEGPTIVQFQNQSDDFEAKVAFLLSKKDGNQSKEIVMLPPNYIKGVERNYSGGDRATVQNISDSDPKVTFLIVSQGFSNSPTAVGDNFNVATDANTPVNKILDQLKYSQKFVIQVVNKTPYTLFRVGAYNYWANWPIDGIEPFSIAGRQFSEGAKFPGSGIIQKEGLFSFASNYEIGKTGKFVQFSASWPPGERKIDIGVISQSGPNPAKKAWDKMSNHDDKFAKNEPFSVRAFMEQSGSSIIWSYELTMN